MTGAQINARVADAWGEKGHAFAREFLGAHRAYEPFTYEAGAALIALLDAAAPDPASDLDQIVRTFVENMQ